MVIFLTRDVAPVMYLHFRLHVLPLPHIIPCRHSEGGSSEFSTPLHEAVCGGHLEIARLLVGAGANVNEICW
jgi:hypothetical protein